MTARSDSARRRNVGGSTWTTLVNADRVASPRPPEAMLAAARSSNELMDGIAKQSQDQAASIEEVNSAVRVMDEMTQHNAALVEETNASIERTEEQASELDRIVEVFTITATRDARASASRGIKGLQERVTTAARSYLSRGNAAVDEEWAEF